MDVDFNEKLEEGELSFPIPRPADQRLKIMLFANVALEAHRADGALLGFDGTVIQADPQC